MDPNQTNQPNPFASDLAKLGIPENYEDSPLFKLLPLIRVDADPYELSHFELVTLKKARCNSQGNCRFPI